MTDTKMKGMDDTRELSFWFKERALNGDAISYLCDGVVYKGFSRYQKIDIVETRLHGRMLFLDDVPQSSEKDEFIYHELLVHPPMFGHARPESVLIIGGAEGASLREVLRHETVKRAVLVDIDGELIDICKHYLPQWHQGSFEDPRTEVVVADGRRYLEESKEEFDVIIVDLSDPLEHSPSVFLFTQEFYMLLKDHLTTQGCLSVQGEGISPQENVLHIRMVNTLRTVFPVVEPYIYSLHSFHRPDGHIFATLWSHWSVAFTVERFHRSGMRFRYLSGPMVEKLFILPQYLLEAYDKENQIITDQNPSFEGVYNR